MENSLYTAYVQYVQCVHCGRRDKSTANKKGCLKRPISPTFALCGGERRLTRASSAAQILLKDEKAFSSSRIALLYYNPQGCSGFKSIPSGEKEVFHKSDAVAFHFLRSTFFRRPDISVLLFCECTFKQNHGSLETRFGTGICRFCFLSIGRGIC